MTPMPLRRLRMGAITVHWLLSLLYTSAVNRHSFPLKPPQMYTCVQTAGLLSARPAEGAWGRALQCQFQSGFVSLCARIAF